MMNLIVFGATGSVGAEVVKQALAKGYEVTAFVRSADKLADRTAPNLHIFTGDVCNSNDVEMAMQNQDAVCCAIGDGRIGKVRAVGTEHIIHAMRKAGVSRLICQTTLGLGESYENLNFLWKHIMFGFLLKKAFRDHQLQEQHLLNCSLNYTIVRPSALTDGEISSDYQIDFNGSVKGLKLKISRADVADFMLKQLLDEQYSRKAVSISA